MAWNALHTILTLGVWQALSIIIPLLIIKDFSAVLLNILLVPRNLGFCPVNTSIHFGNYTVDWGATCLIHLTCWRWSVNGDKDSWVAIDSDRLQFLFIYDSPYWHRPAPRLVLGSDCTWGAATLHVLYFVPISDFWIRILESNLHTSLHGLTSHSRTYNSTTFMQCFFWLQSLLQCDQAKYRLNIRPTVCMCKDLASQTNMW